jgi:hypothetical protein
MLKKVGVSFTVICEVIISISFAISLILYVELLLFYLIHNEFKKFPFVISSDLYKLKLKFSIFDCANVPCFGVKNNKEDGCA